ncbi:unnamed protein product [Leptosia nina]|uniref:Uncharacterized protein n=1 Tax=Leptosia nina TaxID=320188 RepID=A0AAV1JGR7_9NEOP
MTTSLTESDDDDPEEYYLELEERMKTLFMLNEHQDSLSFGSSPFSEDRLSTYMEVSAKNQAVDTEQSPPRDTPETIRRVSSLHRLSEDFYTSWGGTKRPASVDSSKQYSPTHSESMSSMKSIPNDDTLRQCHGSSSSQRMSNIDEQMFPLLESPIKQKRAALRDSVPSGQIQHKSPVKRDTPPQRPKQRSIGQRYVASTPEKRLNKISCQCIKSRSQSSAKTSRYPISTRYTHSYRSSHVDKSPRRKIFKNVAVQTSPVPTLSSFWSNLFIGEPVIYDYVSHL